MIVFKVDVEKEFIHFFSIFQFTDGKKITPFQKSEASNRIKRKGVDIEVDVIPEELF
jgi:ribonuclease HII